MDLNKVMLIGRLTRDPELKSLPSGRSVCTFTVATSRQWTDAAGARQKQSEFSAVVAWGKIGETAGQFLHKASKVYLEGRLQTREWTGTDGIKRWRTEIIADNFIMLDAPPAGGGAAGRAAPSPSSPGAPGVTAAVGAPVAAPPEEVVEEEIKVEDIPF
ncbi:MAG: single-stranded DNA-binding protein [Candidatus Magasanikbacteria bacterium]|nr:single-stranded DNA-binding protein [Candidatus Magasanikbacteria bacterium]